MLQLKQRIYASERLRQAGVAIVLAMIVAITTILQPLDITLWAIQSRLVEQQPSTDIVLVEVESKQLVQGDGSRNAMLGQLLRELDRSGAKEIFVNVPLQKSGSEADDTELKNDLEALSDRLTIAVSLQPKSSSVGQDPHSDSYFTQNARIVSNDYQTDFMGYVWYLEPSYTGGGSAATALWHALSAGAQRDDVIYPDHSIDISAIRRIDAEGYLAEDLDQRPEIAGKTIVVGQSGPNAETIRLVKYGSVPSTLLHLIAADTAKRGSGQLWHWLPMIALFACGLFVVLAFGRSPKSRRLLYALWVLAIPAMVFLAAQAGVRAYLSGPIFLAAAYAAMRATANYKRRHLFVEPRSRLPNFDALRRDFSDREMTSEDLIVVAKVARLDSVFATLSPAEQGEYLRQLATRLALGSPDASVHYDGGKYFAFVLKRSDYADLQGHLEGLRAIASQSISLDNRILDVSITIGVDASGENSTTKRLSSAIAAADQAREAYRPVFVISELPGDSEGWDYSLQSRLEEALSEDRIGINLQPQVDMRSEKIVGVEALARWIDEKEGYISPARFILQCERVGRLDDLTKRVLLKSLSASKALQAKGFRPSIAINVSAIQFVDDRFASLIESLLATGEIDPSLFKIEITESARIDDYGVARELMQRMKGYGIGFSVDDFGVESANLETILQLPFDELKIDRLFVSEMTKSKVGHAIVENTIRLAKDAGMISLAEGIETRESYEMLREMGCDMGQGFHIARPLALPELIQTLELEGNIPLLQRGFG